MRITAFTASYPKFGNKNQGYNNTETHVFAYDDSVSQERRKEIWRNIEEDIPFIRDEREEYQQYVETAKRLLLRKKKYSTLKLPQFTSFESTNIRGGGFDPNLFNYLHDEKKVKRVIALAPDDAKREKIEAKAKAAGVEYVPSKVVYGENKMILQEVPFMDEDEFINPMIQRAKESGMDEKRLEEMEKGIRSFFHNASRNYIENELIPFIDTMKKGNVYIACQYGTFRTDTAISLNSWFNTECEHPFQCLNHTFDLIAFNNLYKKLTDEDKEKLGFTPEFEEQFKVSIKEKIQNFRS